MIDLIQNFPDVVTGKTRLCIWIANLLFCQNRLISKTAFNSLPFCFPLLVIEPFAIIGHIFDL